MKNCLFQYWSNGKMVVDTDLITEEEADELFDFYSKLFRSDLESECEPAMALWINNTESVKYQEAKHHWDYGDFIIIDDELWRRV